MRTVSNFKSHLPNEYSSDIKPYV